jgi:hypothetical protein
VAVVLLVDLHSLEAEEEVLVLHLVLEEMGLLMVVVVLVAVFPLQLQAAQALQAS